MTLQKESPKHSLTKVRTQMFIKIGVLRNFTIFTRKNLYWSLFLIKLHALQPETLCKRDFNTDIFL